MLPACGREVPDPTWPWLQARGVGSGGRPLAATLHSPAGLGRAPPRSGTILASVRERAGTSGLRVWDLRPAVGLAEAIRSQSLAASLGLLLPLVASSLTAGSEPPPPALPQGQEENNHKADPSPLGHGVRRGGGWGVLCSLLEEYRSSRVLGQSGRSSWWKISCGSAGGEGGGEYGLRDPGGPQGPPTTQSWAGAGKTLRKVRPAHDKLF